MLDLIPKPTPLTGRHHQTNVGAPYMPAPTVGWSSVSTNGSAGTSITPTLPAGIQNGDLMVMVCFTFGTVVTTTPPAGWTTAGANGNGGTTGANGSLVSVAAYYRTYATGFTPAAMPLTTSPNRGAYIAIGAFRPLGTPTVSAIITSNGAGTTTQAFSSGTFSGPPPIHAVSFLGWTSVLVSSPPGAFTTTPTMGAGLEQIATEATGFTGVAGGAAAVYVATGGAAGTVSLNAGTTAVWAQTQNAAALTITITDPAPSAFVTVPFGTTTYGAWTQLFANTSYSGRLLRLRWGTSNLNTGIAAYLVDVGIGTIGNEVSISSFNEFIPQQAYSGASPFYDTTHQEIWVPVPAGQRLAVRGWAKPAVSGVEANLACIAHLVD